MSWAIAGQLLGGVLGGALGGSSGPSAAERRQMELQNQATETGLQSVREYNRIRDLLLGSGAYDADKAILAASAAADRDIARDTRSVGAALRNAGYRTGDSEVGLRMTSAANRRRLNLDAMRPELQARAADRTLAAYNPALAQTALSAGSLALQGAQVERGNRPAGVDTYALASAIGQLGADYDRSQRMRAKAREYGPAVAGYGAPLGGGR